MTSKFTRGILIFDCNAPGCKKNFECEAGTFKDGAAEAKREGWSWASDYTRGNVSEMKHYCKRHTAAREGGPRG